MTRPEFAGVYLSGNFQPCPCGYHFGPNELEELRRHYIEGHFDSDFKKETTPND